MSELDLCIQKYEKDFKKQTHCCVLTSFTPEQKAANRSVFEHLVKYQRDIDANGTLPYHPDTAEFKKKHKDVAKDVNYPENALLLSHRELKKIMPIPDVHKTSDCDSIYRFLIARRFDQKLAVRDLLYYIAFREKYNLDHILWDREVETVFNGLDGEELLRQTMEVIGKKSSSILHSSSKPVKIPRPLLQSGWASWCCGVDKWGHVLFYEKPSPKDLAMLEKRWHYVESEYDCRNPEFHAVTPPYSNLLARLYLRILEKGRRLARLINYKQQHILREGLKIDLTTDPSNGKAEALQAAERDPEGFVDNGGGMACLVDVSLVKVSHLTSRKCKDALKVFKLLSMMSQAYYPENMKRLIIVNGGFVFNMIYKLVKPWLDPQTQRKIFMLSATNKMSMDQMNNGSDSGSLHDASPSADTNDNSDDESSDVSDTQNFALRAALEEYIPNRFIPSWYGGKLHALDAPQCYGGKMPKYLTDNPNFAAASQRIQAKVLPELLSDEFLFSKCEEDQPISEEEWNHFCETHKDTLMRPLRKE